MSWRTDLCQPAGIMHGGAIASLVDTAIAHSILLTPTYREAHKLRRPHRLARFADQVSAAGLGRQDLLQRPRRRDSGGRSSMPWPMLPTARARTSPPATRSTCLWPAIGCKRKATNTVTAGRCYAASGIQSEHCWAGPAVALGRRKLPNSLLFRRFRLEQLLDLRARPCSRAWPGSRRWRSAARPSRRAGARPSW